MLPNLSVVIVNYNSGHYLNLCVESVLQSTVDCGVIVVDNASTDNSLNLVKKDQRVRIAKNEQNVGFARANNQVLNLACTDYVLFLNPDCIIKPSTLADMLTALSGYPNVGMAGCRILNLDGTEQAGCRRRIPTPHRLLSRWRSDEKPYLQNQESVPLEPVLVEAISGAFMLVRQSALAKVGAMDEAFFMHCEDLDWCIRFREAGFDILFVPTVEIFHAKGISSQTRPIAVEWHKHKGMIRLYGKHFTKSYTPTTLFFFKLAIWARFYLMLPYLAIKYGFRKHHRNRRQ